MRCDTTANIFMAKKADILEVGCWSEELKIQEHVDLFLRLKAAGKKVVWCPTVGVWNRLESIRQMKKSHYTSKRYRVNKLRRIFCNIWNVDIYKTHTSVWVVKPSSNLPSWIIISPSGYLMPAKFILVFNDGLNDVIWVCYDSVSANVHKTVCTITWRLFQPIFDIMILYVSNQYEYDVQLITRNSYYT